MSISRLIIIISRLIWQKIENFTFFLQDQSTILLYKLTNSYHKLIYIKYKSTYTMHRFLCTFVLWSPKFRLPSRCIPVTILTISPLTWIRPSLRIVTMLHVLTLMHNWITLPSHSLFSITLLWGSQLDLVEQVQARPELDHPTISLIHTGVMRICSTIGVTIWTSLLCIGAA